MPSNNYGPFNGSRSAGRGHNANGMSLKLAVKKLGGEVIVAKAEFSKAKVKATRTAQANGTSVKSAVALVEKEYLPVIHALEYAIAGLKVFANKFPGKSALKMAESLGLTSATAAPTPVDDDRYPNER
jgi:hypothetical protein